MVYNYLNEHSIPLIIGISYCILNNIIRNGRDYIKAFIVLYCLSYVSIYMYTNIGKQSGGNISFLGRSPLREEIFIGNPNF